MKHSRRSALLPLIALIIGLSLGFLLGKSDTPISTAINQLMDFFGQATTTVLPEGQSDPVIENPNWVTELKPSDSLGTYSAADQKPSDPGGAEISENEKYNTKGEVAKYIKVYGHLPPNYVTKTVARNAGWSGGSLEHFFPGCSIGGDVFQNYEGLLPRSSGRIYYECDIDSAGRDSRGAKRIVYSNDGLIYYTDDHYNTFTLLYGNER